MIQFILLKEIKIHFIIEIKYDDPQLVSLTAKLTSANNPNVVKLSHFENVLNYIGHLKKEKYTNYIQKIQNNCFF